jgi:hypothetical protein
MAVKVRLPGNIQILANAHSFGRFPSIASLANASAGNQSHFFISSNSITKNDATQEKNPIDLLVCTDAQQRTRVQLISLGGAREH